MSEATTRVVAGPFRASYANVWEPRLAPGNTVAKYSIVLLIPKKDKVLVQLVKDAIETAKQAGKSSKWNNKVPPVLKGGLKDGDGVDDKGEEYPKEYKGMFFVNANSTEAPGIVDKQRQKILDKTEFYSGCWCYASINFFPYNNQSVGIGCGLQNLMKFKDDESLSGRIAAETDFAAVSVGSDADEFSLD